MKKLNFLTLMALCTINFNLPITAYNKENNTLLPAILLPGIGIHALLDAYPNLGDASLHTAVKQNDLKKVQSLLNNGVNIDTPNKWNGQTPLHAAVKTNNTQMTKFLLDSGANPNIKSYQRKTIHTFGPEAIEESPLHYAIENKNPEIAKILLKSGAHIDVQDHNGNTPLHIAVKNNDLEMVKFLLEAGADQNIRNTPGFLSFFGSTPLDLANNNKDINPEILNLFSNSWFEWMSSLAW